MLDLHEWELTWIAAVQGTGGLKTVMVWFSYLGSEAIAIAVPFTYFIISRKAGGRLFLFYSASAAVLNILKLGFHSPRPYWMNGGVKAFSTSGSYGLPSGHVLGAAVVWPFIARAIGRAWAWALALLAVLLVSISRVYLGVHFLSDVGLAWCVGGILLAGFAWAESRWADRLTALHPAWFVALAGGIAAALLVVGYGVGLRTNAISDPVSWAAHAVHARGLGSIFRTSGEFFGAACGILLAERWACFGERGGLWRRGVALLYALLGVWFLREVKGLLPSVSDVSIQSSITFLLGTLTNLWMLFLGPWIMLNLGVLRERRTTANALG